MNELEVFNTLETKLKKMSPAKRASFLRELGFDVKVQEAHTTSRQMRAANYPITQMVAARGRPISEDKQPARVRVKLSSSEDAVIVYASKRARKLAKSRKKQYKMKKRQKFVLD